MADFAAQTGGSFDYDAFLKFAGAACAKTPSGNELIEALKAFDPSGTRTTIKVADLKKILTELTDEKMSSEMVDEIVRNGDKWRNGEIDYDYFVRMVCAGPPGS